ncbi:MAG: hypothetical protein ACTSQG_02795 [Promethearchaeota archaeon]
MDNSSIFKVWGIRRRLLLTDKVEIDLLTLKKNCFCSTHYHNFKINRFVVIKGRVKIETELGSRILEPIEMWEVRPPIKHRFKVMTNSLMIELSYIEEGNINCDDICRISLGGKIVDGEELPLPELKKRGYLEINKE